MAVADEWTAPVTLVGDHVRLEPLTADHLTSLTAVGLQPDIWRWSVNAIRTAADMRAYLDAALAARSAGDELPFATIERRSGRLVGSTRFMAIAPDHRRLEIGHTWLAPAWQQTALNSEAKLLMLGHAFDVLGCVRVEFKTDSLNERSRRALLGIGATEEGTLRNHMVTDSGRRRHSVYYSILDADWPRVRARLQARLVAHASTQASDRRHSQNQ